MSNQKRKISIQGLKMRAVVVFMLRLLLTCNYSFSKYNGFVFNTYKITDGFKEHYCYGIYADPLRPFKYEISVAKDQHDIRFKNIFENHSINAEFCFELYIWLLRRSVTKIGISDVPSDSDLSLF